MTPEAVGHAMDPAFARVLIRNAITEQWLTTQLGKVKRRTDAFGHGKIEVIECPFPDGRVYSISFQHPTRGDDNAFAARERVAYQAMGRKYAACVMTIAGAPLP